MSFSASDFMEYVQALDLLSSALAALFIALLNLISPITPAMSTKSSIIITPLFDGFFPPVEGNTNYTHINQLMITTHEDIK